MLDYLNVHVLVNVNVNVPEQYSRSKHNLQHVNSPILGRISFIPNERGRDRPLSSSEPLLYPVSASRVRSRLRAGARSRGKATRRG
jgi:hypothetical protein